MFNYRILVFQRSFLPWVICIFALLWVTPLPAQNAMANRYPYLMHLETMNFDEEMCVLLRRDGHFHLENERGDRTRVFEGTLSADGLLELQRIIDDEGLRQLTQNQIVPPKKDMIFDELHVDIFRGDHWQDLFFPDASSRRPFRQFLKPLVRWMEELHKAPHTELTEDEGKNQCQLPKRIVLKRRIIGKQP